MKQCRECGTLSSDDTVFCYICGTKFGNYEKGFSDYGSDEPIAEDYRSEKNNSSATEVDSDEENIRSIFSGYSQSDSVSGYDSQSTAAGGQVQQFTPSNYRPTLFPGRSESQSPRKGYGGWLIGISILLIVSSVASHFAISSQKAGDDSSVEMGKKVSGSVASTSISTSENGPTVEETNSTTIPSTASISVLLTEIEPIQNTDIVVNYCGGYSQKINTSSFNQDVNGKKYESTLMFSPSWTGDDEGRITYYTNYQYSIFTGIIYRPYYSLGGNGESEQWYTPGYVKIYGDGMLLYESPKITQLTYERYSFLLDVSSVREMTIVIGGSWATGLGSVATCGVANAEFIKN